MQLPALRRVSVIINQSYDLEQPSNLFQNHNGPMHWRMANEATIKRTIHAARTMCRVFSAIARRNRASRSNGMPSRAVVDIQLRSLDLFTLRELNANSLLYSFWISIAHSLKICSLNICVFLQEEESSEVCQYLIQSRVLQKLLRKCYNLIWLGLEYGPLEEVHALKFVPMRVCIPPNLWLQLHSLRLRKMSFHQKEFLYYLFWAKELTNVKVEECSFERLTTWIELFDRIKSSGRKWKVTSFAVLYKDADGAFSEDTHPILGGSIEQQDSGTALMNSFLIGEIKENPLRYAKWTTFGEPYWGDIYHRGYTPSEPGDGHELNENTADGHLDDEMEVDDGAMPEENIGQ